MSRESPPSLPAPRGRGTARWLWVACASYVLLRAAILWTNFDATALWAFELYPLGTIARSCLGESGGLPMRYYYDNAAGPELLAFVAAPFYALIGPTYLALKLMPMLLGLGVLVTTWLVLRRLFGARAANVAAFVVAFAPTTMTKYTLIGVGNHSENVFFTLLAVWGFFEMHARGVGTAWLAAAGLFAGCALAVFIGALTPLALLAIAHVGLRGWRAALRDVPAALAGFAVGFAPVVWLNFGSGGRGLAFLAAKFGEESAQKEPFFARAGEFLTVHLPAASTYPSFAGLSGRVADWLFLAATVGAFVVCAPDALRAARAFVRRQVAPPSDAGESLRRAFVFCAWAYLPLTAIAYAASNLKIGGYDPPIEAGGYRYFLPHFAFAIALIGVAVAKASSANAAWARRGALALSAAPLAAGAFNGALIDVTLARPNVGAHYEGHNYARAAMTLLSPKLALADEQVVEYSERFAPALRWRVYWGLGFCKTLPVLIKGRSPDVGAILESAPPQRRADVARGIGTALRYRENKKTRRLADDEPLLVGWLDAGAPHAEQVVEGLCFDWSFVTSTGTAAFVEENGGMLGGASARLKPSLARGLGHACGRLLRRGIEVDRPAILAQLARVPSEHRVAALEGLGAGLADGAESPRVESFAAGSLADADVEPVVRGFRARCEEIWGGPPPDAGACIDAELPAIWREHWERLLAQ